MPLEREADVADKRQIADGRMPVLHAVDILIERFNARDARRGGSRSGEGRRLPPKEILSELVDAAFYASMRQEEGRWATGALLHAGGRSTLRDSGWDVQSLSSSLELTPQTITKLSPAIVPGTSFLLVEGQAGALKITGIGLWPRGYRQYRDVHTDPPFAVTFSAPGRLLLSTGSLEEIRYDRGDILKETPRILGQERPEGPWPSVLTHLRQAVVGDDFPGWLVDGALHQVRLAMAQQHAGGILAICVNDADLSRSVTDSRYQLDPPVELGPLVRRELEAQEKARHLRWQLRRDAAPVDARAIYDSISGELSAAKQLDAAINHLARLSGMDGAVVMDRGLRALAFAVKLKVDMTKPTPHVLEADQGEIGTWERYRLEEHGTRHKSAALWVAEDRGRAAIVVSQDGPAALICHVDERLVYWPLTLTSPWFMHPPGTS